MILNLLINTLINSIPEEIFICGFSLYILIMLKVVEFDKKRLIRLLTIAVPMSAIVSNIIRAFINDINIVLLIMVIFITVMLILTYSIKLKDITKALLSVVLSLVVLQVSEIYILVYLQKTGETIEMLKNKPFLSFYVSIPERLIEYLILLFIYAKRIDYFNVRLNKKQKNVAISLLISSFLYYCILGHLILSNNIRLEGTGILILTASPVIVLWIYYTISYYRNRSNIIKGEYEKMLTSLERYNTMKKKIV